MSVKIIKETIDIFLAEGKDKGKAIGFIEFEETSRGNTWTWYNGPNHFDRGSFKWEKLLRDGPAPKLFLSISFDNPLQMGGVIFNFTRWTIHQIPPPRPWFDVGNTIVGNYKIGVDNRIGFSGKSR